MLSLKDAFLELAGTVVNASICCDVWWELQNAENPNHKAYRAIEKKYDLFFEANAGAQFVAIIVLMYQAYERRPKTQNFHHLIERLENEDAKSADLVRSLRGQVNELTPIWKKVARARSSVIAHLSHHASSAELMESVNLSPNEIRLLIAKSKKILIEFSAYFGILGTSMLNMNATPHTRKLMQALEVRGKTLKIQRAVKPGAP